MKFKIIKKEILYGLSRYTIDLTMDKGEIMNKRVLFEMLDMSSGAPNGGSIKQLSDGNVQVDIFTE